MAANDSTVSATFQDQAAAERVRDDLLEAGFGAGQVALEQAPMGRAGLTLHVIRVSAGDRRGEAEAILATGGAREQRARVRAETVPEADRWEQELPAGREAPAAPVGVALSHIPEADFQEQQLAAERVTVTDDEPVSALRIEYGSEADQLEQVLPPGGLSDEEEEELRERR